MDDRDLDRSSNRSLSEILALGIESARLWTSAELAAVFEHQLAAPLEVDLECLEQGKERFRQAMEDPEAAGIRTFRDLFGHPRPPLALLDLVTEFAGADARRGESPLPDEIGEVVRLLSMAAGWTRRGKRREDADEQTLRSRLDWAIQQPWLDDGSRALLIAAQQKLALGAPQEGPPEKLGEYRLLAQLGAGGMGTVYRALHTEMDRLVALKVLHPDMAQSEAAVARFRREIKAVGKFDHPHIVRAHDARKIGDRYVLVMEYVDGLNLGEMVERLGPLPVADACQIIRQAALGLQCAHEHGLVHRDIKPSNLMIDRQGQVKILDLGLARLREAPSAGQEMTIAGQVMGTPDYIAPEQVADSHEVDIRADIYSLGCTFYKLLTGEPPFCGDQFRTALDKLFAHGRHPVPPVRERRGEVPEPLAEVLSRAVAPQAADRFAAPAELAAALEPFTAGADLQRLFARAEQPLSAPPAAARVTDTRRVSATPTSGVSTAATRTHGAWWQRLASRKRVAAVVLLGSLAAVAAGFLYAWCRGFVARDTQPPQGAPQAVVAAAGRDQQPGVPAKGDLPGWIVMCWTRPLMGKLDLWLFSPDGKTKINLTHAPETYEFHPKFSPDGRQIAFVRAKEVGESNELWVCSADGTASRRLVPAREASERLASPLWMSPHTIYYVRDASRSMMADAEVWRVDLDGGQPQFVFRFYDVFGMGAGLISDVSPDRKDLVTIIQQGIIWPSADVFLCDIYGKSTRVLWLDRPRNKKDARAIWSPDGTRIAWHHNFVAGAGEESSYGVGLATRTAEGQWTCRLQPDEKTFVTPLAWAPHGELLCARIDPDPQQRTAEFFLMDHQFQCTRVLFKIESRQWQPGQRELGRWADWGVVPSDIRLPPAVQPSRRDY